MLTVLPNSVVEPQKTSEMSTVVGKGRIGSPREAGHRVEIRQFKEEVKYGKICSNRLGRGTQQYY